MESERYVFLVREDSKKKYAYTYVYMYLCKYLMKLPESCLQEYYYYYYYYYLYNIVVAQQHKDCISKLADSPLLIACMPCRRIRLYNKCIIFVCSSNNRCNN